MHEQGKKFAAALAAVELFLQEEDAALQAASVPVSNPLVLEPGQWAQSGRVEMMAGRRMIQLRAFSNAR